MRHDLPWRGGAGCIDAYAEPAPSRELSDEELNVLEDLSASPPIIVIHSIPHLLALKNASPDQVDRWKRSIATLPGTDTQTLILKVSTATDPMTLWALHVHLDKRGVAPCLRWPANATAPQMRFTTWLADMHWFAKRHRAHTAKFQSWQRLMQDEPGSPQWHERAYRAFTAMYGSQNVSSYTARGLALSLDHRQPLMMLPTSRMVTSRLELQPAAFADTRQRLLSHAMASPDKSGAHSPATVANRRAQLWRVHVLSGKRPAETARNWALVTGESTARQVIARHLTTIETVLAA